MCWTADSWKRGEPGPRFWFDTVKTKAKGIDNSEAQ